MKLPTIAILMWLVTAALCCSGPANNGRTQDQDVAQPDESARILRYVTKTLPYTIHVDLRLCKSLRKRAFDEVFILERENVLLENYLRAVILHDVYRSRLSLDFDYLETAIRNSQAYFAEHKVSERYPPKRMFNMLPGDVALPERLEVFPYLDYSLDKNDDQ